jgi:pantoate--beta-alanine ligase
VKIITTIEEMRAQVHAWRREGHTLGLVATMGDLHEGKVSLIKASVLRCERTVVSISAPPQGYSAETFAADSAVCESMGADLLYRPEEGSLGRGEGTYVDLSGAELRGEKERARDFCTALVRLFNLVVPDRVFFGEKGPRRLAVLRRLVGELNYGIEVVSCPIVRERDGLAAASRNSCLSGEERKAALSLLQALRLGKRMVLEGERDSRVVINAMRNLISHESLCRIEAVETLDGTTLEQVEELAPGVLVSAEVSVGEKRLSDSFFVSFREEMV